MCPCQCSDSDDDGDDDSDSDSSAPPSAPAPADVATSNTASDDNGNNSTADPSPAPAPDTCPAPAPTSAAGGGQLTIYAFFKGTAFPLIMHGSPDMWDSSQEIWNNMIVQGLRGGFSIPQQIEEYTQQLTRIESCMVEFENGLQRTGEQFIAHLERTFGMSVDELQALWYADIWALEKMNGLRTDNDQNSFVIQVSAPAPDTRPPPPPPPPPPPGAGPMQTSDGQTADVFDLTDLEPEHAEFAENRAEERRTQDTRARGVRVTKLLPTVMRRYIILYGRQPKASRLGCRQGVWEQRHAKQKMIILRHLQVRLYCQTVLFEYIRSIIILTDHLSVDIKGGVLGHPPHPAPKIQMVLSDSI
eukprot:COSAG06_NODE_6021_length_3149_cov_3.585902_3_plen_359_part_00